MLFGVLLGIGISTVWLWVVIYFVTGIKVDKWFELFGWSALLYLAGVVWKFFLLLTDAPLFIHAIRISSTILMGVILYFIMPMRFGIENEKHRWLVPIVFLGSLLVFGLLLGLASSLIA